MSVCLRWYVRCSCLDGKVRGRRHRDCDGWGVLLEELPPRPERGQMPLLAEGVASLPARPLAV